MAGDAEHGGGGSVGGGDEPVQWGAGGGVRCDGVGRGGGLKGIEGMVGLFINTLPVRVEVRGEERVREMMRRVQEKQSKVQEYEYSPLMEVQGWSEAPRGVPLFESDLCVSELSTGCGYQRECRTLGLRIGEVIVFSSNNYGDKYVRSRGRSCC